MAATLSPTLLQTSFHNTTIKVRTKTASSSSFQVRASAASPGGRRELVLTLTAATIAGVAGERSSRAAEIGLFGIRKGLRKAAEEIVREGFEAADKGIESAEKAVVAAEKEVIAAERGIEAAENGVVEAVSFGGLAQAVAVAAAELVGILVATAVVNGILGPEAQKSSS